MKTWGISLVAVVLAVTLSGCSSSGFNPTGTYTGMLEGTGGPGAVAATIGGNYDQWTMTMTITSSGSTAQFGCVADTAVSSDTLLCTYSSGANGIVMEGPLTSGIWTGTWTETYTSGAGSSSTSGAFALTKQ